MSKEFGEFIKKKRIELGFTSGRKFAELIGKSPSFLCRMEKGEVAPGTETLEKLNSIIGNKDELYKLANKIQPEVLKMIKDNEIIDLLNRISRLSPEKKELLFGQNICVNEKKK